MLKIKPSFLMFLIITILSGLIKEVLTLFLVILIHELGHFISIIICNEKIKTFEITAIGCFINLKNNHFSILKALFIYANGIIFNLISLLFINNFTFARFTYVMILFNLIPVAPLDGFQIINKILSQYYEDEYIIDLLFNIGLILNFIITFISLIFKIYFLLCLSIFLYYRLIKYKQTKKYIYLQNYLKLSK